MNPAASATNSSLLITLAPLVWGLINIYIWIILIRVLISWFNPNNHTPFMTFLRQLVDPVLKYTRKAFPLTLGGMDFSPLILLLGLNLLANFLQQAMLHLGNGLDPVKLIPIFILCLLNMVDSLSWLICLMMVARVIISLIDPSPYNPIVMLVYGLTEPLLTPLRNTFPRGPGGLDISAVVATVIIFIFNHFILLQLKMITTTWYYGNSIIRTPPLT